MPVALASYPGIFAEAREVFRLRQAGRADKRFRGMHPISERSEIDEESAPGNPENLSDEWEEEEHEDHVIQDVDPPTNPAHFRQCSLGAGVLLCSPMNADGLSSMRTSASIQHSLDEASFEDFEEEEPDTADVSDDCDSWSQQGAGFKYVSEEGSTPPRLPEKLGSVLGSASIRLTDDAAARCIAAGLEASQRSSAVEACQASAHASGAHDCQFSDDRASAWNPLDFTVEDVE